MMPAHDFYTKLAEDCTRERITVDLFYALQERNSVDLATVAPIAGATGGDLVYYVTFNPRAHGEKLYYSLFRILTRPTVSEVAIKARCSTGMTITDYTGGFL